jgi:hypothetical protein
MVSSADMMPLPPLSLDWAELYPTKVAIKTKTEKVVANNLTIETFFIGIASSFVAVLKIREPCAPGLLSINKTLTVLIFLF